MAPTICSEKKQNQIRTSIKDLHRSQRQVVTASSSSAITQSAGARTTKTLAVTSNIGNYVATGSVNVAARLRMPRRAVTLEARRAQISDNAVSSSTHLLEDESSNESSHSRLHHTYYHDHHHNHHRQHSTPHQLHRHATGDNTTTECDASSNESYQYSDITNDMDVDADDEAMQSNSDAENSDTVAPIERHFHSKRRFGNGQTVLREQEMQRNQIAKICDEREQQEMRKHQQQQKYSDYNNTNGLLAIAIKTIKLVQRNQLLQKRLAQLQLETSEFIASVLANPENRHFRDKINVKSTAASKTKGTTNSTSNKMRKQ